MSRIRKRLFGLICVMIWLMAGTALAQSNGSTPVRNGQSEVTVGVVVDYMGKLRFQVLERGTTTPIPGASVEIYIPSLDRYVLFGLTDENGIYELDVAYNMNPSADLSTQFTDVNGVPVFQGNLLYLNNNTIKYQVYKSGWLLYPTQGEELLESKEMPQTITVYLYKKGNGDTDDTDNKVTPTTPGFSNEEWESALEQLMSLFDDMTPLGQMDPGELSQSGGIPKTGVEGAIPYWIAGLSFFVIAGGILGYLYKKEREIKKREREGEG